MGVLLKTNNMKISEVVKKLQEVQAEKGDLDVWVNSLDIEKIDDDDESLYIVSW